MRSLLPLALSFLSLSFPTLTVASEALPDPTQAIKLQDGYHPHDTQFGEGLEKRQDTIPTPSVNIPVTAAAGGVTLLTPAITAGVSYYKIAASQSITFGWSLTNVLVTPSSLTLKAVCSKNAFTYDIGPASGIPGAATSYVWKPYEEWQDVAGNRQLVDSTYTLQIFDERGPSVLPSAGLFAPLTGYQFAMYQPAAYTPLSEWTCPSCSDASRDRKVSWTLGAMMVGAVWMGWRAVRG